MGGVVFAAASVLCKPRCDSVAQPALGSARASIPRSIDRFTIYHPTIAAGPKGVPASKEITKPANDFQAHLAALERRGLVVRVDRPINKDTELHPLARWQFQGGLSEEKRRAFIFTNVTGSDGRKFEMPVVAGAL